jgi:hypothetical protein
LLIANIVPNIAAQSMADKGPAYDRNQLGKKGIPTCKGIMKTQKTTTTALRSDETLERSMAFEHVEGQIIAALGQQYNPLQCRRVP